MATSAVPFGTVKGSDKGLDEAIKLALADANLTIDDIDTISGFACGLKTIDDIELNSYKRIFGDSLNNKNLIEVKDHVGEARAAAASLSLAHAALMLSGDIKSDNGYKLSNGNVTKTVIESKNLKNVLCVAYAAGGTYTAIVITK